ncbi:hypothetical protein BGZ67_000306 [Mortierella alpina]|nr:hypothetical protein BGZ67_000306 [Mortierella alpina]
MNVAYSSAVRETITENGTTHSRLVSVFENHVKQHGASPSLPQLFDSAREEASSDHDRAVITWLESAVVASDSQGGSHLLKHHHNHDDHQAGGGVFVSPVFFPSEESYGHLLSTLSSAKKTLDICVFTITDDQITRAIIQAVERGVQVRIISDDDKSEDLGSDVKRLARDHNIPTRVDGSEAHMHHKFVIIDDSLVINGSYNWTKGARFDNREDLTLTNSAKAVQAFKSEFAKLWDAFEAHAV